MILLLWAAIAKKPKQAVYLARQHTRYNCSGAELLYNKRFVVQVNWQREI
jgi:hypothetical protein